MSTPYVPPTLVNYNTNPPTDDGAETSANELTWAKHKGKLGDPLKTYAQAIDAAVTAAFAQLFLNSTNAQSTTYIVQTTDRGKVILCNGTFTVTMLPAATAGDGFPVVIKNVGTGVITIDGDDAETIDGALTVVSNTQHEAFTLQSDGSNWNKVSGPVSAAAGEINTYAASGDPTILAVGNAPGTDTATLFHSGEYLQTGGAGAEPSWVIPLMEKLFISEETPITADTLHTIAHNLGAAPKDVKVSMRCNDAGGDNGYSDNENLSPGQQGQTADVGITVSWDDTNVYIIVAASISIMNKSTFNTVSATLSKWDFVATAWV